MKKKFLIAGILSGVICLSTSILYSPPAFSFTKIEIEKYLSTFKTKEVQTQRDELYKILDSKNPSEYFPILLKLLDPNDTNLYYTVVDIIASLGDKRAIAPFFDILSKVPDDYPREYTIPYGLSKMGRNNPEIFQILVNALNDKNYKIRCNVAVALGDIKDKKAMQALIKALKDDNKWVRETAAQALGNFRDNTATKALVSALKDDIESVRRNALMSIGMIGDKTTLNYIIDISKNDKYADVRREAINTLAKFDDEESAIDAIVAALKDKDIFETAVSQIGELKIRKAIPQLLEILNNKNGDSYTSYSLIRALGDLKVIEGIPRYIEILNDENESPSVKQTAIYALGKCKAKHYLPQLIMSLRGNDSYIKEEAIKALGEIGDSRAIPFLLRLYEKESTGNDTYVKEALLRSLAKFSDKGLVQFFIKILDSDDTSLEYVKLNILTGLGKIGGEEAITYIDNLFEKKPSGIYENDIIKALGSSGDILALNPLLNILEKDDTYYGDMIPALINVVRNNPSTISILTTKLETTKDEKTEETLINVLGRSGAKESLPVLEGQKEKTSNMMTKLINQSINLIQAINEGQDYINSLDENYKKGTEMIMNDNFEEAEQLFNDEIMNNPYSSAAYERLGYLYFINSSYLKSFENFKKSFSLNMNNLSLDLIGKFDPYNRDKLYFIIETAMMESAAENSAQMSSLDNLFNSNTKIKSELAYPALYQLAKTDKKAIEIIRTKVLEDSPKARELQAQDKVFTMLFRVSTWESGFVALLPYSRFSLTTPYGKIYGWTNARGFFSCPNILIPEDENYDDYKVGDVDTDPTTDGEYTTKEDREWWGICRKIKEPYQENFGARADEYFCKNVNDRALVLYGHELNVNSHNTLALVKMGIIYYENGNKQKAKEYWDLAEQKGQKYLTYIIPELANYKKSYALLFEKMKEKIKTSPEIVGDFLSDRAEQVSDYLQVLTTAAFLKTIKDKPELLETLETMINSGDKNTVETAFFTLWKLADKNLDARKILQKKMDEKQKLTSYKVKLAPNTPFVLKTDWGRIHAKTNAQGLFWCNYLPDGKNDVQIDTLDKKVLEILESVK